MLPIGQAYLNAILNKTVAKPLLIKEAFYGSTSTSTYSTALPVVLQYSEQILMAPPMKLVLFGREVVTSVPLTRCTYRYFIGTQVQV